jgi:hypothetical protein
MYVYLCNKYIYICINTCNTWHFSPFCAFSTLYPVNVFIFNAWGIRNYTVRDDDNDNDDYGDEDDGDDDDNDDYDDDDDYLHINCCQLIILHIFICIYIYIYIQITKHLGVNKDRDRPFLTPKELLLRPIPSPSKEGNPDKSPVSGSSFSSSSLS